MFSQLWQRIKSWFVRPFRPAAEKPALEPAARKVVFYESDELPTELPEFDITVAREGDQLWAAGMLCPCGCKRRIELMLLDEVRPRWRLQLDDGNHPTLTPSVWLAEGCRSHFWVTGGRIRWCLPDEQGQLDTQDTSQLSSAKL
ncbi:DUF6527 family protein [Mesorhizobium silamurunense]|uniref:DUF6527 family protein n=1 Tax=Mesorhizobium silamurunense TaxID=499528 RepID=UPI002484A35B|nr:DUF6527 family protein [Mesorhizobium silamurunense]